MPTRIRSFPRSHGAVDLCLAGENAFQREMSVTIRHRFERAVDSSGGLLYRRPYQNLAIREIHKRLEAAKGTNYSTTVKMLAVMLQKGLVKRDEEAQPHVYRPVLTRAKTGKRMLDDLIEKVYEGSTMSLVLQALSSGKATKEELDEIRRMLDEMEGK